MKCVKCGAKSIINLSYGGGELCRNCFTRLFEKRVKKTIRTNKLLAGDDRVLVALSGGKDSAVALSIISSILGRNPKCEVAAITVDEGISGCSRNRLEVSERLSRMFGVEHHVFTFKDFFGFTLDEFLENPGVESNPCTYCGVLRRRLINTMARELDFTKVATGHNLDDEVQAALMNFCRGEVERIARLGGKVGVTEIAGFVPRIKPLREVLEEEVLLYARLKKLPLASGICPYSRDAYRKSMKRVVDELDARHGGTKYQMLRSVDKLSEYLKSCVPKDGVGVCGVCGEPCSGKKCKVCLILKK